MATVGESADSEGTSLPSSDGPRDPLRLLQSLPVPIFVAVDHHLIFVNEAQARILGAAVPGDVIGQSLEGFISPESRESFFATLDEVAGSAGTSRSITEKWLRVDGRLLNIEYVIKSIPYEDRVAIEGVLRKVVIAEAPSKQQRSAENAETEQRRAEVTRLTESLKSERSAAAESLREAVARERKQAEDRMQSALAEERRRSARAMDEAATESRKAAEAKTQEAIARERAAAQEAIARERKKLQDEIARERSEATAEARKAAETKIQEAVAREKAAVQEATAREKKKAQEEIARERKASKEAVARERATVQEEVSRARSAAEEEFARERKATQEEFARERRSLQEELTRERQATEQAVARERSAIQEAVSRERAAAQGLVARERASTQEAVAKERASAQEEIARERAAAQAAIAAEKTASVEKIAAAVAAERIAAKKALKEAIAIERSQAESAVRDASRVAAERALKEASTSARTAAAEEFQSSLANQRSETDSLLKEGVARARAETEQAVREAVDAERTRSRLELDQAVQAERTRSKQELEEAIAAEKARFDERLNEAAKAERERVDRAVAAAMEKQRTDGTADQEKTDALIAEAVEAERTTAQKTLEAERSRLEATIKKLTAESRLGTERAVQAAVEKERAAASKIPVAAAKPVMSSALTERLLDSMAEGVYGIDLEGRFTHINRAAAEMLEHEPSKIVGKSAHEILHPRKPDGTPYAVTQCPLHGGIQYGVQNKGDDQFFFSRKGAHFPVDYAYAPIYQGSDVIGGVVTFTDITERKMAIQETAKVDRMSSLGRFAAASTQEFNKILDGIRAAAEVIRWHSSGEELEDAKSQMTRLIERGSQLTRQLSRFTDTSELPAKPLEVVDWFQTFLQAARVALTETIELNFKLPDESLYVKAEANQLNQIFMNLVLNARDAMPQGGRVTLSIDKSLSGTTYSFGVIDTPDAFIHFVVEDTGVGIPAEHLSKIFEPLFTTKGSGTAGLGLSIAHQLVRKLGGSIFVESTVGVGTQFHIFLPAAYPELEAAIEEASKPLATPRPARRKRIVLIGADALSPEQIDSAAQVGVEVEVVPAGYEAIGAITREEADALVMDVSRMQSDGTDMYRQIATRWPKLPIIVSTNNIDDVNIPGGFPSLPNVRYLPYDLPTLLQWVEGRKN